MNEASPYRTDADASGYWADATVLGPILRRPEASSFPRVFDDRLADAWGKTFRVEADGFAIDFPAGNYFEKCFAVVEPCQRARTPHDRRAIEESLRWRA